MEQRQPRGRYMLALARLKPGVDHTEAQAQMNTIAAGLTSEFPEFDTGWSVRLVPLERELSGEIRPALLVLSGAVAFVLLIACANVANLLLARGAVRQREIAIRSALGANRGRVVRQLLTESLVLGVAGGLVGLLVARWSLDALLASSPVELSAAGHVRLSYPVLAFTGLVSFITAIVCGIAPALESARADVQDSLKEGARQAGSSLRHRRLRQAFVVAELALAVVLLIGAGLLLRSLRSMQRVNPGFASGNVLTMRVALPFARYKETGKRIAFFSSAVARLGQMPGVRSAGAISFLPFAGLGAATDFTIVGEPPPAPGHENVVDVKVCDNGYFAAMKVPLLRGRLFTERELHEKSNVVVISEEMARRFFPGTDPIGRQVSIDMTDPVVPTEIVGVVGDVKDVDLVTETRAMSYWPHPQLPMTAMTLVVRTSSEPLAMAAAAEAEVHALDRDQPVSDVRTMDQWVARSLAQTRFSSLLLTIFAALALVLACIGIYGVMAYAVSQRTSEIGVRLALGADRRDILRLIVGNAVRLTALGLLAGIVLSLALSRSLASLLFETRGTDPVTFITVISVLGVVALVASYIPARRAARIPPVEALRYQ
jgi:putative ABC transport system permease protein